MVAALAFFALVPFVLVWTQMQSTHHEEKEPVFQQSDLLGRGEFGLRKLRKEYIRVFGKQAHAVHGGGRRTPGEPGEVVVLESAMDVYVAGIPRQPRVIARDLLMAALIRDSSDDLQRALLFCVETQGTAFNPLTGEEPGKVRCNPFYLFIYFTEQYKIDCARLPWRRGKQLALVQVQQHRLDAAVHHRRLPLLSALARLDPQDGHRSPCAQRRRVHSQASGRFQSLL